MVVTGIGVLGTSTDVYSPSFPGRSIVPPARNCADLTNPFKIRSVKVGRRHTIKVTVSAPEAGKLTSIALAQTWKTKTPKKWFDFGSAKLDHPAGGDVLS